VRPRQVPVEHHDVVPGDGQAFQRVVPVEHHVDDHALPAQSSADGRGEYLEVFGDKDPHVLNDATAGGVSQVSVSGTVVTPAAA
jgi:hypothetical protein